MTKIGVTAEAVARQVPVFRSEPERGKGGRKRTTPRPAAAAAALLFKQLEDGEAKV